MHPEKLTFDEVALRLTKAGAEYLAAEVHGIAAGLFATADDTTDALLAEILPDTTEGDLLAEECLSMLRRLADETLQSMQDTSMGFELLLPDDETRLQDRAAALRDWCEGFLYGLGLGEANTSKLPSGANEAVTDMTELTRLDPQSVSGSEEDEQAYSELVEFARMASLLIREELTNPGESPTTAKE